MMTCHVAEQWLKFNESHGHLSSIRRRKAKLFDFIDARLQGCQCP